MPFRRDYLEEKVEGPVVDFCEHPRGVASAIHRQRPAGEPFPCCKASRYHLQEKLAIKKRKYVACLLQERHNSKSIIFQEELLKA